jgi:RHS repeat-associated protein
VDLTCPTPVPIRHANAYQVRYDPAGRRAGLTVAGRDVAYGYDPAGRVATLADGAGPPVTYRWDDAGRPLATTRPNGVTTTYQHDPAGRLTALRHSTEAGTLAEYAATLDPAGSPTTTTGPEGTTTYGRDDLGRLTSATTGTHTAAWTYDAAGNRTCETIDGTVTPYGYDPAGRLATIGADPVTTDTAGQITAIGDDRFGYDDAGRLTTARIDGTTTTYAYDGDGHQVRTTTGTATTNRLWDTTGDLPALLKDGATVLRHGPTGPLTQTGPAGTAWPLTDRQGSVRAATDPAGAITGTATYTAFGTPTGTGGGVGPLGYTGATSTGGPIHLGARDLLAPTGRFLTPDTLATGGPGTTGYNRYAYAANDPLTYTDPTGHSVLTEYLNLNRMSPATAAVLYMGAATASLVAFGVLAQLISQTCIFNGGCATTAAGAGGGTVAAPATPGTIDVNALAQDIIKALTTLTQAATAAAAAACAATSTAGLLASVRGSNPCDGSRTPIYFSGGMDQPETTQNIVKGQSRLKKAHLHRGPGSSRAWLSSTTTCNAGAKDAWRTANAGMVPWCDEYPFNKTTENRGSVATVELRLLPELEQRTQAGKLTAFYNAQCKVDRDGNPSDFIVIPVPHAAVPTFSFCPGR